MNAAIPRMRKMMKRSQMRPIPHIIVVGKSVICIMSNAFPDPACAIVH
jgi:hypothetical protein